MKRILFISMLIFAILAINSSATGQNESFPVEIGTVVDIVDGDTIDVDIDGTVYRVRYIGINTPEVDEECGMSASEANRVLVESKTVALRRDVRETDQYDRLLRYVYVGETFVNASLVADGWAEAVEYPPDTAFAVWFSYLAERAASSELGCYPAGVFGGETTTAPAPTPKGVTVTADSQVNLRGGPGTNYAVFGTLSAGQTEEATARNAAGDWLYLEAGAWVAAWVVSVDGEVNTLPTRDAPPPPEPVQPMQPAEPTTQPAEQPAQPTAPPPPTVLPAPQFTCDCSKTCGAMASCDEAYFQLNQCGCGRRDGDNDGVPCESICPGG